MAYKTLTDALKDIFKTAKESDLKFFGNKALFTIDAMTVAEISIGSKGTSGQYPKLDVKIQHKENGKIAENEFIFEDYLKRTSCDNPHSDSVRRMHIWVHNTIDWYIVKPISFEPIVKEIFDYIGIYA